MKVLLAITAFTVVACHATAILSRADKEPVNKFQPLKCRNGTYGPSDAQAGAMQTECGPKYGTDPGQENPSCIFYCQSEILGLLNSEGLPTRDAYDSFAQHSIVEEYRELATKWFRDCYDKHGQVDKADTTCAVAGQLNVCIWSIQPQLICTE